MKIKKNIWKEKKKPIIALAPMAGINDFAFKEICSEFEPDIIYSEMASATALVKNPKKTLEMIRYNNDIPYIIQLFGSIPEHFEKAIKVLENELDYAGIDINFGCPVNKVLKQGAGAILMQDLKRSREIISACVESSKYPVSIKTRTQSAKVKLLDFLSYIDDLDISAIMIHGRTLNQGFVGDIDYKLIKAVKKKYSNWIVLANGGINNKEDVERALSLTKADGVGIARGALGRPWIFKDIKNKKKNGSKKYEDIMKIMLKQAEINYKKNGEAGMKEMRKHLAWYVKDFPGAKDLRKKLVRVNTMSEIKEIIKNL